MARARRRPPSSPAEGEGLPARDPAPGSAPPPFSARLYTLPPDEFVPAREALARQLAEAGDPRAGQVRKLRRPVGLAWVLNRVALAEQEVVEALLLAGDRLRAGQRAALEGNGPEDLRGAEQQVREAARSLRLAATRELAIMGRRVEPATLGHVEVLLRTLATTRDDVRARFRGGLLDREPAVGGDGFQEGAWVGRAAAAVSGGARGPERTDRKDAGAAPQDRARERAADLERRRAEEAEARRREEAVEARRRARERARLLEGARSALADAERVVQEKEAGLEAAQRRLDAARAELQAAAREAERCRGVLERLGEAAGGPPPPGVPAGAGP